MTTSRLPGLRLPAWAALSASLLLTLGCSGNQSPLNPAGIQAERIDRLWWLYFWVAVAVYLAVMAVVVAAVLRRSGAASDRPLTSPPAGPELRRGAVVTGAVVLTGLILIVLAVADFLTGRRMHALGNDEEPLVIQVIGHQWWWELRYPAPVAGDTFTTANEIHIPVGRVVQLELQSTDVIHSFWVPNLHGKRDMIPGHPDRIKLRADRAGTFWGQCAEFCGYQHATMRLLVVAEPEEDFQQWLAAQRQSAAQPATDSQRKGAEVFLKTTCANCHTIQGTGAHGTVGPDLTHLGSRQYIASGTLPNTRGHLGGWVMDPQSIRPGVRMPLNPLKPDQLRTLLDYLENLK